MKLLFVADGRSPTAAGWIGYFIEAGHSVHLVSTYPAQPLPAVPEGAGYGRRDDQGDYDDEHGDSCGAHGTSSGRAADGAARLGPRHSPIGPGPHPDDGETAALPST